ncbi:MAG: hypothetical protein IPP45_19250 [Sphingomonadales bacterium]|nr:hypothetical protein [Sphingomonadales bacterium]
MTPESMIDNGRITSRWLSSKNGGRRYRGRSRSNDAFARSKSNNVAAVKLYQSSGGDAVIMAARNLGIKEPLSDDPSLALGTSE